MSIGVTWCTSSPLLIEPQGIEIPIPYLRSCYTDILLIEPQGIEIQML